MVMTRGDAGAGVRVWCCCLDEDDCGVMGGTIEPAPIAVVPSLRGGGDMAGGEIGGNVVAIFWVSLDPVQVVG